MNAQQFRPWRSKDAFFWRELLFAAYFILALSLRPLRAQTAPGVIMDMDMSSDHDDVADLYVADAFANLGVINLLGCISDTTNGGTALCMNAINTYFGMPNVPIGITPNTTDGYSYPQVIANTFPHPLYSSATQCPAALGLYRQILAAQRNNSVYIIATGYYTDLAALVESGSDQYSPLTGLQLIQEKVKELVAVAGVFPSGGSFNFNSSGDNSAYIAINQWPGPVLYVPDNIGWPLGTAGNISITGTNNPIRVVWDQYSYLPNYRWYPYPSWSQEGMYYTFRAIEAASMFGIDNVGECVINSDLSDTWVTSPDPGDQGYLLEEERYPIVECINALIDMPPNNGIPARPGGPSNLHLTAASASQINLQWDDNSYNESGFIIERRSNGVYSQIATVGAKATTYSDTAVTSTNNASYRVRSYNAQGVSNYAYGYLYSGWTEYNFDTPTALPIYNYYNHAHLLCLNSAGSQHHVTINNDSTHGPNVAINVETASRNNQGDFYIYFFYQDKDDWYRADVNPTSSQFQKSVGGAVTQVGPSGPGIYFTNASDLQLWQVLVQPGSLQLVISGSAYVSATDTFSFSSGKIGLGGYGSSPVWQNFNFDTSGLAPTGAVATPGPGQESISWNPASGASSYDVYRGVNDGLIQSIPVATGVTGTNYVDTTVNGSDYMSYYYEVAAVRTSGTSGVWNQAFGNMPSPTGSPFAPTGLTATGGTNQISLTWSPSGGGPTSYVVYRGNASGGECTFPLAMGISTTSFIDTNAVGGDSYYYRVGGVNVSGTSLDSKETSATATRLTGSGIAFANPSFETPAVSGYSINPAGSNWTFTNNAGIEANGSVYSYGLPIAPDGSQAAFLQGVNSTFGTMSQSVSFPAGTYTIIFYGAQRNGQLQPVQISVGGTAVGTYSPASDNFSRITSAPFTVAAGIYTVTFAATNASSDLTTFIDMVTIGGTSSGGGSAPFITSATTASAAVNSAFSYNITATNNPISYNATGLPDGLTVNANTGAITGTPTTSGTSTVTLSAINATGTGTAGLTLVVNAAPPAGIITYYHDSFARSGEIVGTSPEIDTGGATWACTWGTGQYVTTGSAATLTPSTYVYSAVFLPVNGSSGVTLDGGKDFTLSAVVTTGSSYGDGISLNTSLVGNSSENLFSNSLATLLVYSTFLGSYSFTNGSSQYDYNAAITGSTAIALVYSATGGTLTYEIGGTTVYTQPGVTAAQIASINDIAFGDHGDSGSTPPLPTFTNFKLTVGSGAAVPSAPTGLTVTGSNGSITLNWNVSAGAASYNVYRGATSGGESAIPIATGITSISYTNSGLVNGATYYYTVSAVNSSGTSPQSAEAGAPCGTSYAQWASLYFGGAAGAGAESATPLNDGLSNLLKFVTDINPSRALTATDWAVLPKAGTSTSGSSTYSTITYRKNPAAIGVNIAVQTSADLSHWTTVTPYATITTGTDAATGDPLIQHQVPVSPAGATREFIRLSLTGP